MMMDKEGLSKKPSRFKPDLSTQFNLEFETFPGHALSFAASFPSVGCTIKLVFVFNVTFCQVI